MYCVSLETIQTSFWITVPFPFEDTKDHKVNCVQSYPTISHPTIPNHTQPNQTQPNPTKPNQTQPHTTIPNHTQPVKKVQILHSVKLQIVYYLFPITNYQLPITYYKMTKKHLNLISILIRVWLHRTPFLLFYYLENLLLSISLSKHNQFKICKKCHAVPQFASLNQPLPQFHLLNW